MAIQLQRILESQRSSIVPLQGQLLFATDSKRIYVGDGATLGGIGVGVRYISTSTDSGGVSSVQINNVAGNLVANGTYNNLVFNYDEESQSLSGYADTTNLIGNLLAFDESLIVDSNAKSITVSELNSESLILQKRSFVSTETALISLTKVRGTSSVPDDVIVGDLLGQLRFYGYSRGVVNAGIIRVTARTVQPNLIAGTMGFAVSDNLGVSTEMLRLDTLNGYINIYSSQSAAEGIVYRNAQNTIIPGRVVFARSRTSQINPTNVFVGDRITDLVYAGHVNGLFRSTAMQTVTVREIDGDIIRSAVNYWMPNELGVMSETVSIEPNGAVRADIFSNHTTATNLTLTTISTSTVIQAERPLVTSKYLKLPVYSNDAERDASITGPEEGMVVFNKRDDIPGTPQYQGYTTSSGWISLV